LVIREIIRSWFDFPTYFCECNRCGEEFETADEFRTKFCSPRCATIWHQKMSVIKELLKKQGKKFNDNRFKYNDNYVIRGM
jgi:predicted nucleic acid-binding Zn ribbon protein